MGLKPNLTDKWRVYLSQARSQSLFSDIRITSSDGSAFEAHKLVLGLQWFLQDSESSDALIIEGFDSQVIHHFLDILYSGITKFRGEENLKSLKELAGIFGVNNLSLETFVFHEEEDFEEEDELYYESDESEEMGSHGSLTVTLEENLSKRDILVQQDRIFVCPRCGEGFVSHSKLEAHEKTHDEYGEDYEEDMEEDDFDDDDEDEDEDEEDEEEGKPKAQYPCKHCSIAPFESKSELSKHTYIAHCSCKKCGKEFKDPKSLNYHSKYVCPKIKREFFKCRVCDSKFPSPRDARRHEKGHSQSKSYKCSMCNIVCKSASFLSNHVKVAHNPENLRFKCSTCGKAFLKSAYLSDHINRFHVSEKQFECELCSKKFSTRQDLQKHSKFHKGNTHNCTFCDQTFTYRTTLTQHIRSAHTGDKPYKCRPCNKSFGFLEVLKKHKKSHDRKGDQTIIVTAPKGQKGSKSYIDFSSPSTSSLHSSAAQPFLPTPNNNDFNTNLCPDMVHFEAAQGGVANTTASSGSFPNYPSYPKGDQPLPDQITTIDIMELLSKN